MYSVETCGCCVYERKCAYEHPCNDCSVLRSCCKESYFEEAEKDDDDVFQMHVEDVGWVDCVSVEPIQSLDWRDYLEEELAELNRFELIDYSREASIVLQNCVLQNCYESTKALWECFADAFESFSRTIMKPIEDCFEKMFGDWEKHFDGIYSKPKMMEYFKMQPNVCNLNNKIRKARNLL